MTVYFVCPAGNPNLVKIGHTKDLEQRLAVLGGAHEGGIELLAQCEGAVDAEAVFHNMFIADRIEGEWFVRTDLLENIIDALSVNVTGRRTFGARKPVVFSGDREIAKRLLTDLLSEERAGISLSAARERAFQKLHEINPIWTRRRVRAIWDGEASRIDFFEVRDLMTATNPDKAADWAEWICPEIRGDE